MKVRRANQKDVEMLSNFVHDIKSTCTVYGHTLGKEYFKSLIRSGFVFVAESEGEPIGMLLAEVDARIQFSNILHVVIHPKFSCDEVRSMLVRKHMDECRKMNISDIALQTPEKEKKALKFFKELGFSAENKFVLLTKSIT